MKKLSLILILISILFYSKSGAQDFSIKKTDDIKLSLSKDLINCQYFTYWIYGVWSSGRMNSSTYQFFKTFDEYINDSILHDEHTKNDIVLLSRKYLDSALKKFQEIKDNINETSDTTLFKDISSSLEIFTSLLGDELINQIDTTGKIKATVSVILALNEKGLKYSIIPKLIYTPEIVIDIDGNIYHTVAIGKQIWMIENLKTTYYRNGDIIPNIQNNNVWYDFKNGAYCDYDNDKNKANTFGRLYNWYAINDSRNIAPEGWHVATKSEWDILIKFLDDEKIAGKHLKESGAKNWTSPNNEATNTCGFTALPGGQRNMYGDFRGISEHGFWWTSSEFNSSNAWYVEMVNSYNSVYITGFFKSNGYSVRCVKD